MVYRLGKTFRNHKQRQAKTWTILTYFEACSIDLEFRFPHISKLF